MRADLVLLPSPLLGPAVWAPVAERLGGEGWTVHVAPLPDGRLTPDRVAQAFLGAVPESLPVVLVPHSNAGLYVPLLGERRSVVGQVFVDAALPPAAGTTALAPAAFLSFLETRVGEDGLLPPWTQWWDAADVDDLFPDAGARGRVEREQARVPLQYFTSRLSVPAGWANRPSGYLAFGDTYADERRMAQGWGWPVDTVPGLHLHQLVDPDAVADALTTMLARLHVSGAD